MAARAAAGLRGIEDMSESPRTYHAAQLRQISAGTIGYYDRVAEAFWHGTREHDVAQNYAALLGRAGPEKTTLAGTGGPS